jgi:PAS domain S-box-containing protein
MRGKLNGADPMTESQQIMHRDAAASRTQSVSNQVQPCDLAAGVLRSTAQEQDYSASELYKFIFDNVQVGISLISPAMEIIALNTQMQKWFPTIDPSLRPKCYCAFNNPPLKDICPWCPTHRTLKDGQVHESVTETPTPSGVRNYRIISSPIHDSSGELVAAIEMVDDITAASEASRRLRESEERFRVINDAAQDAIIVMDSDGNIASWNKAAETTFGYTSEEALGRNVHRLLAPDRLYSQHLQAFGQFRATGEGSAVGKTLELPALRNDGSEIIVELSLSATKIDDKWCAIGIVRDITERKNYETMLREHNHFLQDLIDAVPSPLFFCNRNEMFLGCNSAMEQFVGKPRSHIIGRTATEVFPETVARASMQRDRELLTRGGSDIHEVRLPRDGEPPRDVLIHKATYSDFHGGIAGIIGIIIDITERKRTEESLRASEETAHTLINATTDSVCLIDSQGVILTLNDELARRLSGIKNEMIGKCIFDLWPPDVSERRRAWLAEVISAGQPLRCEDARDDRIIDNIFYPLLDGEECVTRVAVFGRDITDRMRAETEREKMVTWRQGVTHLQQSLLTPAPLDQKLTQITDCIVELLGADFCRIWLIQPGDLCDQGCIHSELHEGPHVCGDRNRCLHLRASSGRYTHIDGKGHGRVPFGCYKIGQVASGQDHKLITNDAQNDPMIHNPEWARDLGLVSFAGYQLRVPDGEILGVLALFSKQEISPALDSILDALSTTIAFVVQQARSQEALQRSENKFRTLYDSTSDAVILLNEHGFIDCNRAALSMFGCDTKEQFCSLQPTGESPPVMPRGLDSMALANELISAAMAEGNNHFEWTHKISDTVVFVADVLLNTLELDGKPVIQTVVREITESRLARDQLALTTSRYTTMINTVPAVMYVKNVNHEYITGNLELARLADRQIEQIVGRTTQEIFGNEFGRKLNEADQAAMDSNREMTTAEERVIFPNGEERWVSTTRVPLHDEQGQVSGLVGLLQDVTDQHNSREKLVQSDKLAAIGTLAAGVAHEINNPMGFITSNLNTMKRYLQQVSARLTSGPASADSDAKHQEMLKDFDDAINESIEGAGRVRKIVADLKSFSRLDKADVTTADLNEGLESTLNIVWNELKYHCKVEREFGDIPRVNCRPSQLNQVFLNMLVNAGHAIEHDHGLIRIRTWADETSLYVSISDNGKGIRTEDLPRIFEPFFTTKDVGKGTGLGLSLAFDIIKTHGGLIDVWSEVGEGTEFVITLPRKGIGE